MGRVRTKRSEQRPPLQPAKARQCLRPASHASATLGGDYFRPRLEMLEQRLSPGDVLLGVWALTLGGHNLAASPPSALAGVLSSANGGPGLERSSAGADALAALSVLDDAALRGEQQASVAERVALAGSFGSTDVSAGPVFAEATVAQNGAALPTPGSMPRQGVGMPAVLAGAWSDASASFFALAAVVNGERAADSAGLSASAHRNAAPLAFDAASGQLAIQEEGGVHTVSEALTAAGFVDVTLDGQEHSSNPRSASFDQALAGATGATVAGIRYAGGGQDTLTLGSQQVAGGLTVQASGATVITENVATTGSLAIQAPNITVNGALQGSSVSLAASGWVTVNATGRIASAPAGTKGGIGIAAGVFVNSGQLHADGAVGGAITVQARNILNAGPITADSTGPGTPAGQVSIAFTGAYVATTAAVMSASSASGPGGQVILDGGGTGHLFTSGRQLATGSVGGAVALFGRDVVLDGASVNASGGTGGGSVRLGGDVQDRNPAVGNTQTVTVTSASTIRADAQQSGNGGQVAIAADQSTEFDGVVSARGGSAGGTGGFIDVSGQGDLSYDGSADAGAPRGKSGTLRLDPKNLIISAAPAGVFPQFDLIDPDPTTDGNFANQVSVLSNGNVVVTNPKDSFSGSYAGAAYLFDGLSGALISSLVGSNPGDEVGLRREAGAEVPVSDLSRSSQES
jgi:hypothetical protein